MACVELEMRIWKHDIFPSDYFTSASLISVHIEEKMHVNMDCSTVIVNTRLEKRL